MNLATLWAEIEDEQAWRIDEMRFFQNQLATLSDENQKEQFRRALILLLYAHFEGFCKFALSLYATTINHEGIACGDANHAIAAASLADLFAALRDPSSRCPEFRTTLPDDSQLHRFARDREFFMRTDDFARRLVVIPDKFVDTEANLKPVVLRKILYRLGFQHDLFQHVEGEIHRLLNMRNGIAHGDLKSGVAETRYDEIRVAVFHIMDEIKRTVMAALQNRSYLKIS